jgi:Subtilase family
VSVLAAAAIVTALVGLPAGATAPPPGSVPAGTHVQVLDRQLGIVAVDLRRRDAERAVARLRRSPGVRYATVPVAAPGLASSAACSFLTTRPVGSGSTTWRSTIHMSKQSAAGFTVGIPDTGADLSRLGGTRDRLRWENFTQGKSRKDVTDEVDHGTEIASLIAANRPDLGVQGVAPDVGLAIARIALSGNCNSGTISRNLIAAFAWFRSIGDVQIVNVSAYVDPNPALVESLHALQESGTLVVAATGNEPDVGTSTFPAAEPHVLGVGALAAGNKSVWSRSGRGPQVDLVAPGGGMGVVYSSYGSSEQQAGSTVVATSFATPLVTGAAALVWAKHSAWDASRVAAALTMSAKHLSGARPNTTSGYGVLDVKAALHAMPPPDLDEPNDWASAARKLRPLAHKQTYSATVGGNNDPVDAYPIVTRGRSVVTITGSKGALQAYLMRGSSLGAIESVPPRMLAAASTHASGHTVHLKVPKKGSWYVVVTSPEATSPVGYALRVP